MKPYALDPMPSTAEARELAETGRWFVPQWKMLPLSPSRCLVRNPLNDASAELSSGEFAILSSCEGCLTLSEHEARAARRLSAPPAHRPAFRELLERCARGGLLVSLAALTARFGAGSVTTPQPLGAIAVRTADRPKLLARLLSSAEALQSRTGNAYRWIVFDDSRDAQSERANRAAIDAARQLDVAHYDRAAAGITEGMLLAQFRGAAREIEWLLAPGGTEATYGRPLNHALLHLAGSAFLVLDDDVVVEPRLPPFAERGFAVTDALDELTWYPDEETLLRHCAPAPLDPFAEHARWIGLPMAQAWAHAQERHGDVAAVDFRAEHAGRFSADARIVFTHGHSLGDPGSTVLPLQLLSLPQRSRQWLAANADAAGYAFGARINWRGQTRLRLAPKRLLTLTTVAGIDNSRLMPPAARSHRSEDLLLGALAQWIHPHAWQIDLPFGLPHLREPPKRWLGPRENPTAEPLPFLLEYLEERAAIFAGEEPEQRMLVASVLFADLARASDATLSEMLREHAAKAASTVLFSIREQLDDATLPASWRTALASWLESPAFALDERSLGARAPGPAVIRSLAESFAGALAVWPRLWNYCRDRNR
ncbi:MAG TPA: hypothetical protein VFF44_05395 [Casimicrobiaceae bacterium]|nr:hypothetical protein [Casimicrobiaceae bacterium]